MRKILMIIMLILMINLVIAQPIPPDVSDFEYPDQNFGEPDTFIYQVGDFFQSIFGGQQFTFISDASLPEVDVSQWYQSNLYTQPVSSAVVCQQCGNREYCEIYHVGTGQGATWQRTFGDLWRKEYSTDNVDLMKYSFARDWNFNFYTGYYCYTPVELPQHIYSCRDDGGNVQVYKDGKVVYTVAVAFCKITTRIVEGEQLTQSQIDSTFVDRADVCYTCSGGQLLTKVQDGCSRGWSLIKPSTCDMTVECWKCDSQDGLIRETFTNYCRSGYEEDEPICVTCYTCDGSDVISKYDEGCGGEWSRSVPVCEVDEPSKIVCYQCQDGQIAEETFDGKLCPERWGRDEPEICVVNCYTCSQGAVVVDGFAGMCPEEWAPTEPISCDIDNIECYSCAEGNTGIVLKELAPACKDGWTTNQLTKSDCTGERNKIIAWFQDNSPESYIIVISGVVILIALLIVTFDRKGKSGVGL